MNEHLSLTAEYGNELLALSEHLFSRGDAEGLGLLHEIVARLILNGVNDATYSIVEIGEYIDLLTDDVEKNNGQKSTASISLLALIKSGDEG